ncbi:MAG: 2-oxoacid:acceptor oxidoreductase subunit alpha, partial [Nitrospirae bacterium]
MDYTVLIGGEAGQGIQTIGGMLAKVFARAGFHVFSHQDYMSRIRGGHNFYQIRFSDRPVHSSKQRVDLIVALNLESIEIHRERLNEQGMVVYDGDSIKRRFDSPLFLDVPFEGISREKTGTTVMANTVATASVLGMLGMELDIFEQVIRETFKKKGDEVISKNIEASRAGYDYAVTKCLRCNFSVPLKAGSGRMLINGNQAVGLGAVSGGCRFYSAYPMTPSTGIMIYLASKAKQLGIVVEQAEDEISAINMALGASFAGLRAMTGTSGGGFALMVEGLSLAGMTETPIVIAEVQRPGPATGLPTRTEQADLLFVLHAGHGEFPRVVFAPGTPEQALYLTNRAFELSEKYQVPVLILSDQYLADSQWSYESLDLDRLVFNDYRVRKENFRILKEYKRHAITESGVSPLAVPSEAEHVVVTDSDEHDEEGHIIED